MMMFLNEIANRELKLGKEMEEMLRNRAMEAMTQEFINVYVKYLSTVLPKENEETAYQHFMKLGNTKVFFQLRESLSRLEEGKQLLMNYYQYLQDLIEKQKQTQKTTSDMPEVIEKKRWGLFKK